MLLKSKYLCTKRTHIHASRKNSHINGFLDFVFIWLDFFSSEYGFFPTKVYLLLSSKILKVKITFINLKLEDFNKQMQYHLSDKSDIRYMFWYCHLLWVLHVSIPNEGYNQNTEKLSPLHTRLFLLPVLGWELWGAI